ncbi:cytochrome c oxidase subunit IV [Thamnocephalis sphaerospora]|uniref:Cytochrome c oxidase subunit IV n=1 Tax=Thamnocephalis sphaerospora TaxID=78915 RepID=A0A4P9XXC1_9FUNG|nr:cytochrome c oxidase subunit IV [Thamnocephalis sphaerospora]|eukprot:RKP10672.1 cytochrome c oxidase subunit IV [Thamnocephalis sphaerospora]
MNHLRNTAVRTLRAAPRRAQSTSVSAANIESTWSSLTAEQRATLERQLDQRMAGDWKALSLDEKKAAYYIAFGPHGAREPLHKPGFTAKVLTGVTVCVGISTAIFAYARSRAIETPHTMSKEWREKTNEYMVEQKANPHTGMAAPDYTGKGFSGKY